jgi:phosphotriesterase-related protein
MSAGTVQGVLGPIAAADLGTVLMHEHVAAASGGVIRAWPELFGGTERLIARAVADLEAARAAGVDTIVDATTFDLGRDMDVIAEVARRSGMQIVASSGHWLMPVPTMATRSVEQLAAWFERELSQGADGTSYRAGIMKIASEQEITPFEARVLEAAARTHRQTGAAILTHSGSRHGTGELQADMLERHGVDPGRVVIGHSDDSSDVEYLSRLAARGYYLGMDRLPNGAMPEYGGQTVEDRLQMIATLVERGYANRIVVSTDDPIWAPLLTDEDQATHVRVNPDRVAFIPRVAMPRLRELGVSADDLAAIMVRNPAAWLTGGA